MKRRGVLALASMGIAAATTCEAAIPIQPHAGPLTGCTPPGSGACAATPGEWFGSAGDDSVHVWVGADGASIDSVRVVVNSGNCTARPRYVLTRRWTPAAMIRGDGLPQCRVVEWSPCVAPNSHGFQLEIRFPTSSCALVELWLRDPAGRSFCPSPCPALDDIGVDTAPADWGAIKRIYRDVHTRGGFSSVPLAARGHERFH